MKLAQLAAAGAAVSLVAAAVAACTGSDTTDAPDVPEAVSTATPARTVEPQPTPAARPTRAATPSVEATATAEPTAAALDPETLAATILRGGPTEPRDIELFRPAIYAAASSLTPAQGPAPAEDEVRTRLAAFTAVRFPDDPASRDRVMTRFDSGLVAFKIPDPTLRAAFASLTGTIAEPAIDLFVTGTRTISDVAVFVGIEFGPVSASGIYAQSHAVEGGRHARLVVDEALSSEHFALFTGILAHEILHHDIFTNDAEEAVAHWIEAMVHAQVISRAPEVAYLGTKLSRRTNTLVLAMLNSRNAGSPGITLRAPGGTSIFPGSPLGPPDFATWVAGRGRTVEATPAPLFLRTVMESIVTDPTAIPRELLFDTDAIELLSGGLNDEWLSRSDRVRLAILLQLLDVDEIGVQLKLSASDVIDLFDLAPILRAREAAAPR